MDGFVKLKADDRISWDTFNFAGRKLDKEGCIWVLPSEVPLLTPHGFVDVTNIPDTEESVLLMSRSQLIDKIVAKTLKTCSTMTDQELRDTIVPPVAKTIDDVYAENNPNVDPDTISDFSETTIDEVANMDRSDLFRIGKALAKSGDITARLVPMLKNEDLRKLVIDALNARNAAVQKAVEDNEDPEFPFGQE